jgi:hypothetical protein
VRRIWTIVGVGLLVGTLLEIPAVDPVTAHGSASTTSGSSPSHNVFRPYGSPGGLRDEFEQLAAEHPDITKLVTIGRTVRGEDIVALKMSRQARRIRDGRRPATLYLGGQHGREWIPPEMVRRLAHHVVDGYRIDPALTDLVDTTELWFVPVANPDGYDFTFTPGNRLWRKNQRSQISFSMLCEVTCRSVGAVGGSLSTTAGVETSNTLPSLTLPLAWRMVTWRLYVCPGVRPATVAVGGPS